MLDDAEQFETLKAFVYEKSSMSSIHYYSPDLANVAVDQQINVCNSHKDTGMLTFAIASAQPGLEIWDLHEKNWIPVESLVTPHQDIIVFVGEKMDLFWEEFEAAPNRVVVENHTERFSLIYLLDASR